MDPEKLRQRKKYDGLVLRQDRLAPVILRKGAFLVDRNSIHTADCATHPISRFIEHAGAAPYEYLRSARLNFVAADASH